jgi:hypothetical protein
MTLIEILFNRVRKIEPETHWEVEGCAFTFPIANRRTGRVWAVVRQEATQIFIEASLIERSELGVLADCVSTELLRENGASDEVLLYAIVPLSQNAELLAIKTFFDYRPNDQSSQTYIARFNSRYALIKRHVNEFDGLLKRLLEACGDA